MRVELQNQVLEVARSSIRYGLVHSRAMSLQLEAYDEELKKERACFITLSIAGELRGCIGSLVAHRPLVIDVAENAFSAAFRDPRFSPLRKDEFDKLEYHISILSIPVALKVESEQDLLSQLKPGVDGLVLTDGAYRATFLPAVWEQLPDKCEFLKHLKMKAGLPIDYWSDSIIFERYAVESIFS